MSNNKEFLVVIHLARLANWKYNSYSRVPHVRLPLCGNVRFKCYLRIGLTPCGPLSTHTFFLLFNFFVQKMKVRLCYPLLLFSARNLNLC